MITAITHAPLLGRVRRLDAKYFLSSGVIARHSIDKLAAEGAQVRTIAGPGGYGRIAPPSRTKRVYAALGEASAPYLRPYDVFDYLPQPADHLSLAGTSHLGLLVPNAGTILQTCSGRNLGPVAYADAHIASFAVSDDMLRLTIDDFADRIYALTYLMTATGQALLTQNKTGAVIDHLSASDFAAVPVARAPTLLSDEVVREMTQALEARQRGRLQLAQAITSYESRYPVPPSPFPLREGWTQPAAALARRLDAAFYDPAVASGRATLARAGGVAVGDVAEVSIPNRYHRYYVEQPFGRPVLSGRQLLQAQPINLRFIASRSFAFEDYELKLNSIAFGGEGRAEERLGFPTLINRERAGWLASEHVMRVVPKSGVNAGWLYLAFASRSVLAQVKAIACGSVIDEIGPSDLRAVTLPPLDETLADACLAAWNDLSDARECELRAISHLESWLSQPRE